MRVCDLSTGLGKLHKCFTVLREQWARAQEHWRDENSRQFEEHRLRPIPRQMQILTAAVHRLGEQVEKATRALDERESGL